MYDTQSSSSNNTTSEFSNLNMSGTQLGTGNMQMQYNIGAQKETFNYTFEELQQYFLAHGDTFNQEHEDKETGIYNYSQKAKDVYTKMLSIEDKINKKVAQYDKELQKVNKNLSKAMQKFMHNSKNKADKDLHKRMMEDKNVKQYLKQRQELIGKKNNVRQREQLKFMKWEKGHMRGENVIERNNNYLVTAAKSRAILNGCDDKTVEQIDKGVICDTQGVQINDNLTNIASSVANLLTEQYNKERDTGKKNKILQWISNVWKNIKEFLGIPVYDTQSHDKLKQQLQDCISNAIKNNNISANDVKNNIDKIQETQKKAQIEYQTNPQQYINFAQSYQTNMSTQQGLDGSTVYNPNYSMDNKSMLSYNSGMSIINANNNTMNSINGVNAGKLFDNKVFNLSNTVNNISKDTKIAQAIASQNNNMQMQPPINALNNNINQVISSPNPQNNINQVSPAVNNNNNIMSSTNPQNNINSVNNSNNMPQQIPQSNNINQLTNNNNIQPSNSQSGTLTSNNGNITNNISNNNVTSLQNPALNNANLVNNNNISPTNPQANNINQAVVNNINTQSPNIQSSALTSNNSNITNNIQMQPQMKALNNNINAVISSPNSKLNNANQIAKNNSILLSGVQPNAANISGPNIMANNISNQPGVNSGVTTFK